MTRDLVVRDYFPGIQSTDGSVEEQLDTNCEVCNVAPVNKLLDLDSTTVHLCNGCYNRIRSNIPDKSCKICGEEQGTYREIGGERTRICDKCLRRINNAHPR